MKLSFYYYWVLTQVCYYLGHWIFCIGDFFCYTCTPDSFWDKWYSEIFLNIYTYIFYKPYSFFINKSIDFNDKGNVGLWGDPVEPDEEE